jgi:hypothetical protein
MLTTKTGAIIAAQKTTMHFIKPKQEHHFKSKSTKHVQACIYQRTRIDT